MMSLADELLANLDYDSDDECVNNETSLAVKEFVNKSENLLTEFHSQEEQLIQSMSSKSLSQSDEVDETRGTDIYPSQEKIYLSNFFDICDRNVKEFLSGNIKRSDDDDVNEIIKKRLFDIESLMKTEKEFDKRDLLCRFIRDILWCGTYENVKFEDLEILDRLKVVGYRAAECYKTNVSFWTTLAKVELRLQNSEKARENLEKALDYASDSERLWIYLIEIYTLENENIAKGQEVLDEALFFFADNGFEIKPFEWIKAAINSGMRGNSKEKIVSEVLSSLMGIVSYNEIDKCTKDYEIVKFLYLIVMIKANPKKKQFWARAIFNESRDEKDLHGLFKIACVKCPNDVNLRNLIQAKIRWDYELYAYAQRVFNIVNEDTKWKNFIAVEYSQFQDNIKEFRSKRHKKLKMIIEERRSYFFDWRLPEDLKDEWLLGEHELVQKVLAKAVSVYHPYKEKFWSMKVQIEAKLGKLDQAAETFENAIKSVLSCDTMDFYLKFAEFEERRGNLLQAEKVLELGILQATYESDKVQLWIAKIHLKLRNNEKTKAQTLLNQVIGMHPRSGELWAETISMEERSERGKKAAEALRICQDDKNEAKYVMLETAKYFFSRGNIDKSRKWFEKTIKLYPDFIDAWIYYYKFEKSFGNEDKAKKVLIRCIIEITYQGREDHRRYGEKWNAFKNYIGTRSGFL